MGDTETIDAPIVSRLGWRSGWFMLASMAGIFVALQVGAVQEAIGLPRSTLQLAALPLIVFGLSRIEICGVKVPRFLLLFVLLASIASLASPAAIITRTSDESAIAQLDGDGRGGFSRSLATQMGRFLGKIHRDLLPLGLVAPEEPGRLERTVRGNDKAQELLARSSTMKALVWGSAGFIGVSLHPERAVVGELEELDRWLDRINMKFVKSVPVIGMSLHPLDETSQFLGALFASFNSSPLAAEHLLRYAAGMHAAWRSPAHRAYAWWLLGNLHLSQALRGGRFEAGELACADAAYVAAKRLLKMGDNPELYAAVLNNRAVALAARATTGGWKGAVREIRNELSHAARSITHPNHFKIRFQAARVAERNLKRFTVHDGLRKFKAGKRKGKKHAGDRQRNNQAAGARSARVGADEHGF